MKPISVVFAIGACLASGAALAQQNTTTYQTNDGQLIVNWGQPPAHDSGPPPAWEQMDANRDGSIDTSEASAYTLLANDFKYADSNRNGRISKAEYTRWVNAK